MKRLPQFRTLASSMALLGLTASVTSVNVNAQQDGADIEEVVITGSRAAPRTAVDSMAPIDVIGGTDFENQGTTDINDLMRNLVPSFNVDTQDINDTQSIVRPTTLRGLPADNTLILVNSKRRHRSSAIQFGNNGIHFPDISMIPPIALQQVEVLRDGASAQYGSDAIAGVMNFRLKENREGGSLEYRTGLYTNNSDGESHYLAGNVGLPLGPDGFVSLSFDASNQNITNRAIQRGDAQAILDRGNEAILSSSLTTDTVMRRGLPDQESFNIVANAGIRVSPTQEIYTFGGYSERDTDLGFFFRNPENRNGIFTDGDNHLMLDLTDDQSANCREIPSTQRTGIVPDEPGFTTSSLLAAEYSRNNPDCFSFAEWNPGGYTPQFGGNLVDAHNATGIRGELADGTHYDAYMGFGFSEIDYFLYNTVNATMGPDSPRSFRPGIYTTIENTVGLDLVKPFEMDGLWGPLNVAYGIEWRREVFRVDSNDEESYLIGPYANQGTNVGSDGFQGFGPNQQGSWDRKNWGFYVDLEADVTERLLLGAALRYEDFYDSFGDTTNGKLSMRYRLFDGTNIRSTISTGFRAPSPGQANISNLSTGITDGVPVANGQIPPTNPIAQRFGGEELGPEKSRNFSLGIATELGPVDLTVDFYHIEVRDRILNSGTFEITPEIARELQESGISGASTLQNIRYFNNDMDTTNRGVEAVASYTQNWDDGQRTVFNGSWAYQDQSIDSVSPGILTRAAQNNLTDRIPANRINLRANHFVGDFRITGQANIYDEFKQIPSSADPSRDHWVDGDIIFSGEVAYTYDNRYTFIIGADNIFDQLPPKVRPVDFSQFTTDDRIQSVAYSPNGRFVYARLRAEF